MSLAWTLNYWQLYHSQLAPFCFSSQPVTRYCFTFQLTKQPQFCMVRSLIIHRNVCPNVQNTSETTRQMVSLSSFLIISIISMVDKITDHRKMLSICLFVCLFLRARKRKQICITTTSFPLPVLSLNIVHNLI